MTPMNRDKKVRRMEKKARRIFPFEETSRRDKTPDLMKADEKKRIADGLYALRRANQNRRNHLRNATYEKKARLVNSEIPGVDYTKQVKQYKANFGQLVDSKGN